MTGMFFAGATSFNDLSSWDVSSVTNMIHMFRMHLVLMVIYLLGMFQMRDRYGIYVSRMPLVLMVIYLLGMSLV